MWASSRKAGGFWGPTRYGSQSGRAREVWTSALTRSWARSRNPSDLDALAGRLAGLARDRDADGDPTWAGLDPVVNRFGRTVLGPHSSTGNRVMSSAGILLLIMALANVANLFLVQSRVRARELAVRRALGASRFRVLRQLTLEAAAPAALGFVGATLVAGYGLAWREKAGLVYGGQGPIWVHFGLEWSHLVVLAVATVLCTIVVAVLSGLREFRTGDSTVLRAGRGVSAGTFRLGRGLLSVEIAVGGTLLLLASLLIRSGWNLRTVDWGFETDTVAHW